MPVHERILAMGITGSGKSYQWLKMAETLQPTGVIFRVLDTDNAIQYMLDTQFPHLNNVLVHPAYDWPEYKAGIAWLKTEPIKDNDWVVVDMADEAWSTVQSYFVGEVFQEDIGEYFLDVRRELQARGGKSKVHKGEATSLMPEGLSGWIDWVVINKLYNDWIRPIIYQIPCHVYATTKVDKLDRGSKDVEMMMLFGDLGIKPSGQKRLGHQMHTVFLLIPGADRWYITTAKDRGGRQYFKKVPLVSIYHQYFVAKAGWPML